MPEEIIKWQAPEYHYYKKSTDWFWAVGIIAIGLIVSAILLKNFLFVILVLISGFAIILYGAKKPRTVWFSIDSKGITVERRTYSYENLESFWIDHDPPQRKELFLKSKKTLMPLISIMLGDADHELIRQYLSKYLKEEKLEESLITAVARILKF